jgi:ribosomal protein S27E
MSKNKTEVHNTGHLLSIYCPHCRKVTDKISFNLLREAGTVEAFCPDCWRKTIIEYNGKRALLYHSTEELEEMVKDMMKKQNKG